MLLLGHEDNTNNYFCAKLNAYRKHSLELGDSHGLIFPHVIFDHVLGSYL